METVTSPERKSNTVSLGEQNKKLVRMAVEEIWNKGNYSVTDKLVASDFVIHLSTPGKEVRGPEGVRNYFSSLRTAFPDIHFTIKDQVAEENKVVTHWIAEGTHLGNFDGLAPTGRHFRISAIDIDYIQNGKFAECWTNVDELSLLQQLGALTGTPTEEYRTPQAWDRIAEGYHTYVTDTERWLANEALHRAGVQAGQQFLDVAAGSGGLSIPAARMGAYVTAVDWSPEMIRYFELRVREEKLSHARGMVMDGHHLLFDDNQFDVSGSQFGVMLFPDQPQALREMTRVTKRGGKVLLIAYGNPQKIDFLNFFIEALRSVAPHFPGLPTQPPPLEFQAADPVVLYQRFADAGLKDIQVDTVTEKLTFYSGEELWQCIRYGNPIIGSVLAQLHITEEQVETIKQQLERMVREHAGNNGYAILTNPVNIAVGTK